jgi:hypothetical protein
MKRGVCLQNYTEPYLRIQSNYRPNTRAIRRITSGELLTKQALERNVIYKNRYVLKSLMTIFRSTLLTSLLSCCMNSTISTRLLLQTTVLNCFLAGNNLFVLFAECVCIHCFGCSSVSAFTIFYIIPVYLQSVQVHSVNCLKEGSLGEGRSLALFYSTNGTQFHQLSLVRYYSEINYHPCGMSLKT